MKRTSCSILILAMALLLAGLVGCGPNSAGLRAISERFLDEGHANRMIRYGDNLYKQGKIREAYAAFLQAENLSYTSALRTQSRARRMYVEEQIRGLEMGNNQPPPIPNMDDRLKQATLEYNMNAVAVVDPPPPWVKPSYDATKDLFSTGEQTALAGTDAKSPPPVTSSGNR
jgi:hypothetical protein